MFNKEKGICLKLVNVLLLIWLVSTAIYLCIFIIVSLLPSGGDYSSFNFDVFMIGLLSGIWNLMVDFGTIYLVNKKINLFDKSYPFSRHYLNFILLVTIVSSFVVLGIYLISIIFNVVSITIGIKYIIAILISYSVSLYLCESRSVLLLENGKALNLINFILLNMAINALMALLITVISINDFNLNVIDFVRSILLELVIIIVPVVVLIFINKKNNVNKKIEFNDLQQ